MTLQLSDFTDEMDLFCDPAANNFPTSAAEAATKWGNAFQFFLEKVDPDKKGLEVLTAVPTTMTDVTGVASAFTNVLDFSGSNGIASIVDAWEAGIQAIVFNSGALFAGGTITQIDPLIPATVSAAKAGLLASLTSLLGSPSSNYVGQMANLAQALLDATQAALITTCTITNGVTTTPQVPIAFE